MTTIHFTDRDAAARTSPTTRALAAAATAALGVPSGLDSHGWRWRLHDGMADLYADRARQPATADPDGRRLAVCCGAALHHTLVSLAAGGHTVTVERCPDPAEPALLARVRVTGTAWPDPAAVGLLRVAVRRRPDRRPCDGRPVPADEVDRLAAVARANGARLRVPSPDVAGSDARYAVLCTDGEDRAAWLRAGEALSAVLLAAAGAGLVAAPTGDVVEVAPALRSAADGPLVGLGHPVLALRIGWTGDDGAAAGPRRPQVRAAEPAAGPVG